MSNEKFNIDVLPILESPELPEVRFDDPALEKPIAFEPVDAPPEPKGHSFNKIRVRKDGSYTVNLLTSMGEVEYHVMSLDDDPKGLPGLYDDVLSAIAAGAETAAWDDTPVVTVQTPEQLLTGYKVRATEVIGLIQMAYDVAEGQELVEMEPVLKAWKRYRIALEKNGLDAVPNMPTLPEWIN